VANYGSASVSPVNLATRKAGPPIPAGPGPQAIVATPDGKTIYARPATPPDALAATVDGVYAVDGNSDELTKLGSDTATRVGYSPDAIAVSGTTAYVVNTIDSTVTPVDTRTGKAARPLNVGAYTYPTAITITGQSAVVVEPYGYAVVVINLKTRHVYAPITVGGYPSAVAITA
jgi:hyaluronoglucosaminidase